MTTDFVVLTGPIRGSVTLPDGREVNVSAPVVEADDLATAEAVAAAIGERYAAEGHPDDDPADPQFTYVPPEEV